MHFASHRIDGEHHRDLIIEVAPDQVSVVACRLMAVLYGITGECRFALADGGTVSVRLIEPADRAAGRRGRRDRARRGADEGRGRITWDEGQTIVEVTEDDLGYWIHFFVDFVVVGEPTADHIDFDRPSIDGISDGVTWRLLIDLDYQPGNETQRLWRLL